MRHYAIKVAIDDPAADALSFADQKTMYGGKAIAVGDTIYLFASGTEGGSGLVLRGSVTAVTATPRRPGVARQTPRVSVALRVEAPATRRLGRSDLRRFSDWSDGRPQTELNFKLYRQATDKIVGVSPEAAAFLDGHFGSNAKSA